MTTETFTAFVNGAPAATLPLGPTDYIPVIQDGQTKHMTSADLEQHIFLQNGTGNAAANTTALQAALDLAYYGRGKIFVYGDGACYINATLVIGANTDIELAENLRITNLPTNNFPVLVNYAYANIPFSTVVLTWSAGLSVSVAWTAHGKAVGDYVWLQGTAGTMPTAFFGIFRVQSVTNANAFVLTLNKVPSGVPSGTAKAKAVDTNIKIRGGMFDYNARAGAGGGTSDLGTMGIILCGIQNLEYDTLSNDAVGYAILHTGVRDLKGRIGFPYQLKDGIKLNGPAQHVEFDGVFGTSGDDFTSVQPFCDPPFVPNTYGNGGECIDIKFRNVDATYAEGAAVNLYWNDLFAFDVEIDGVTYQPSNTNTPVELNTNTQAYTGSPITTTVPCRVTVKNLFISDFNSQGSGMIFAFGPCNVQSLDISHIILPDKVSNGTQTVFRTSTSSLGDPTIGNMKLSFVAGKLNNGGNVMTVVNGSIKKLTVCDCQVEDAGGGSPGNFLNFSGFDLKSLTFERNVTLGLDTTILFQTGVTGNPLVQMENNYSTDATAFSTQSPCTFAPKNNRYNRTPGFLLVATNAAVNLIDDGSNSFAGGSFASVSGTGSINTITLPLQSFFAQGTVATGRGVFIGVGTGFGSAPPMALVQPISGNPIVAYGTTCDLTISRSNGANVDPNLGGQAFTDLWKWDNNGAYRPITDNSVDMGSSAVRPANTYVYQIRAKPVLLASLGSASGKGGARSFVSDLLAYTPGSTAVGGGSVNGPVFSDNTNWIMG